MPAIRRLIAGYPHVLVQEDLPRVPSFLVADHDGEIVGCCALQIYSRRMAEIRSLAVVPGSEKRGIGRRLVEQCLERARERGVKQVLAVSSEARFFEALGFSTFFREKTALFHDTPT